MSLRLNGLGSCHLALSHRIVDHRAAELPPAVVSLVLPSNDTRQGVVRLTEPLSGSYRWYYLGVTVSRGYPPVSVQVALLEEQDNRCLYCGHKFGDLVVRKNNDWQWLELNWDHFVPYSYCASNHDDNWVAACHLCNSYKSDLLFKDVLEVRWYVFDKSIKKQHDPLPFWYTGPDEKQNVAVFSVELELVDEQVSVFSANSLFEPHDFTFGTFGYKPSAVIQQPVSEYIIEKQVKPIIKLKDTVVAREEKARKQRQYRRAYYEKNKVIKEDKRLLSLSALLRVS